MTSNEVLLAIKQYISKFAPIDLKKVFVGYQNRVQLPKDNDFVIMTLINNETLGTPIEKYNELTDRYDIKQHTQAQIQIDFYGKFAMDRANAIIAISRTIVGNEFLAKKGLQTLFADNSQNVTMDMGEKQYVDRYIVTLNVEYDASVVISQDGFNTAKINLIKTEL